MMIEETEKNKISMFVEITYESEERAEKVHKYFLKKVKCFYKKDLVSGAYFQRVKIEDICALLKKAGININPVKEIFRLEPENKNDFIEGIAFIKYYHPNPKEYKFLRILIKKQD